MSTIKVDEIFGDLPTDAVDLPNKLKVGGILAEQGYTASGSEPSSPNNGDYWWDTGNDKLYRYMDGGFKELGVYTAPAGIAWGGDRGIVSGTGSSYNDLLYFDISGSGGNSANFGDMTVDRTHHSAGGSSTRAIFSGGYSSSAPNRSPVMDYVTPSTPGNCTDFGDLTVGRNVVAAASNGTRLLNAGGYSTSGYGNIVDYVTVANTGNATDFGDLTGVGQGMHGGGVADATRAVFGGGIGGSTTNTIDYFTIATPGNGTDFGDLLLAVSRNTACSDATRGVFCGGSSAQSYKNMEYITIQTTGNGTDFGDLLTASNAKACTSNSTIGIHISGVDMDKFTIQTPANATDFGDILESRVKMGASSGNAS